MPGPTAEPTLEELNERLDHVNQQLMVSALSARFADQAVKSAEEAKGLIEEGDLREAYKAIGRAHAYAECSRAAGAVAQEL